MSSAEGYDVLRLIEHSRSCYVSSEYVKGTPFIRWLKYHPNLSKEQLFLWIHELARQLECIHRCRGRPCYRYVNPYSIIITEKKELYFLDMNAKSNERAVIVMQRRSVREHFLPPDEAYYQTESVFLDIYGLGKTIQYLLSVSEPEPKLTKHEEARFQKIISKSLDRHSKRTYTQVSELRKAIPVYRDRGTEEYGRKKKIFIIAAGLFFLITGVILYRNMTKQSLKKEPENVPADSEEALSEINVQTESESALKKELGFLYFLDNKDYEKSRKYFAEDAGDHLSEGLAKLSEYMLSKDISGREAELKKLLTDIERAAPKETEEQVFRCLIEGYRLVEDEEAFRAVIRLGDECRRRGKEKVKQELTGYLAYAYEKSGEHDKAIEEYMQMLDGEGRISFREELYKKLVFLYQESGEADKAGSICRKGIDELKDSSELRLIYIRMLCADSEVEREICAQTIRKYIGELPEIVENEEFQKLKQEYGIVIEGEKLWVGR